VWRATDLSKPEDEMARGRTDERTKVLFADAERSAERVVGQLRMAIALSLGAVFAIAVVMHAQRDDAVRPEQITAAFATILAYLALGALSYHLAVPHRFRPWMPWAFVTGDAGFLLTHIGLDVVTAGLGGNYVASLPVLWLAPAVLAFGALQYNPARLLYATALLAGGLVSIAAADFVFDTLADTPPAAIGRFFDAPPNIMRLAMLIAAGAILVAAAARTRAERGLDDWSGEDHRNVLCANAGAKFGADNRVPCGYGSAWTVHTFASSPIPPAAVAVADLDGDGRLDIITDASDGNPGKLEWFKQGSGNPRDPTDWTEHMIDTSVLSSRLLAIADMNQDGHPDIVWGGPGATGRVGISYNNGDGSAWTFIQLRHVPVRQGLERRRQAAVDHKLARVLPFIAAARSSVRLVAGVIRNSTRADLSCLRHAKTPYCRPAQRPIRIPTSYCQLCTIS
jgi:hypothetical protein